MTENNFIKSLFIFGPDFFAPFEELVAGIDELVVEAVGMDHMVDLVTDIENLIDYTRNAASVVSWFGWLILLRTIILFHWLILFFDLLQIDCTSHNYGALCF